MTAPVAQPFSASGDEDTPILTTLIGSDLDDDPLSYEIVSGPANGIVEQVQDGADEEYVYKPLPEFNGTDSFTYRVFDGTEYSEIVTVDITVNSVPDAPVVGMGFQPQPGPVSGTLGGGIQTAIAANASGVRAEVWHGFNQLGDTAGIYLQLFDNLNNPIGSAQRVNTTTADLQADPSVAKLLDGSFLITWTSMNQDAEGAGVYMQRVSAAGAPIGSETQVNTTTAGQQSNADATYLNDNGWVVTWASLNSGESHIYTQRFDASGNTVGGELLVDTVVGFEGADPSIAKLGNGNYVVTWTSPMGQDGDDLGVFGKIFSPEGAPLRSQFQVNSNTGGAQSHSEVVALANGDFVVAFTSGPNDFIATSISFARFDEGGNAYGPEIVIPVGNGEVQGISLTALPDGGFALAWELHHPTSNTSEILVQRYDFMGASLGMPVLVHQGDADNDSSPSLAFTNGQLMVLFAEGPLSGGNNEIHDQSFTLPARTNNVLEGSESGALLPLVTLTDVDSADLNSLSIRIKAGFRDGDELFVNTDGTTLSANMAGDTLTISGTGTLGDFEQVLRTLYFAAQDGGGGGRGLEITAIGTDATGSPVMLNLTVTTTDQSVDGSGEQELLRAGNGNDTLFGFAENDTIIGNDGNDELYGGNGSDSLLGGTGDDTLNGGLGADTLEGGFGDDIYFANISSDVVVENEGQGYDTVYSVLDYTLTNDVEHLILMGTANTNGTGSVSANKIDGNSGNNSLDGSAGQDTLLGRGGNDTLNGGSESDLLMGNSGDDVYIADLGDTIFELAAGGNDTVMVADTYTLGNNLENLALQGTSDFRGTGNSLDNFLLGNSGNNTLLGNGGNDTLDGGDGFDKLDGGNGNDVLTGGAGNDTLYSGYGTDTMNGGAGNDIYYVETILDAVIELDGEGTDTVYSQANYTLTQFVERLVMIGEIQTSGTGNNLANRIEGSDTQNTLSGAGGNDTLFGNQGADVLLGGDQQDKLYGGIHDDQLFGQNGNDSLYGGTGSDMLTGGAGFDAFVFSTVVDGVETDSIADFTLGEDIIMLSSTVFSAIAGGPLSSSDFVVGTAALTGAHRIVYDDNTGALYYDADGVGGNDALQFATVSNMATLTNLDFMVV